MSRIAILLLVAASLQDPSTRAEDLPFVRTARGNLRIWRAATAKVEPVKESVQVGTTDRVGTESGAYAMLATDGDVVISLKGVKVGSDRGLSIERGSGKLTFRLYEGKAVVESFKSDLLIETPHGRVEAKQAYFLIEVTEKSTRIVAIDGPLTFTTSQGKAVVESGHESMSEKGGSPSPPRPTLVEERLREFTVQEDRHNLLQNPGFEDGLNKWRLEAFTVQNQPYGRVDTAQSHSGKHSLRFTLKTSLFPENVASAFLIRQAQTGCLVVGKRYLFRVYVRKSSTEGKGGKLKVEAKVHKGFGDAGLTFTRPEEPMDAWFMIRGFFTATHADLGAGLSLSVDSTEYDCTLWADDFFLAEISEAAPSKPGK